MSHKPSRWMIRCAAVLGLALGLTGCAGGAEPASPSATATVPSASSPFPPRPAELQLDQVDPCALLTAEQQTQLGVKQVAKDDDSDELGSAACQWANHDKPYDLWLARLIVKRDAAYALGSTTGVQVVRVDGFSAVQTAPPYVDPNLNCVLVVDVAQGQSLGVQYSNFAGDHPGINHDVACQLDRHAAELMVRNLRGLTH